MGYYSVCILFVLILLLATILPLWVWQRTRSWPKTVLWSVVIVPIGSFLLGGGVMTAAVAAEAHLVPEKREHNPEAGGARHLVVTFLLTGYVYSGIGSTFLTVGFLLILLYSWILKQRAAVQSLPATERSVERCPLCGCTPPARGEFCEACRER